MLVEVDLAGCVGLDGAVLGSVSVSEVEKRGGRVGGKVYSE